MNVVNKEQKSFMEGLGFNLVEDNVPNFSNLTMKPCRCALWRIDCNRVTSDVPLDCNETNHTTIILQIMCAIAQYGREAGRKEVRDGLQKLLGVKW